VVAVSRAAHSGPAMPSPVTPIDAAGQLLLRPGIISATCHAATAGVVTQPSPASARAQLTVDTAAPTTMLPLGVVVTTDVPSSLSKVRHMSPEIAKSLLQQSGLLRFLFLFVTYTSTSLSFGCPSAANVVLAFLLDVVVRFSNISYGFIE